MGMHVAHDNDNFVEGVDVVDIVDGVADGEVNGVVDIDVGGHGVVAFEVHVACDYGVAHINVGVSATSDLC